MLIKINTEDNMDHQNYQNTVVFVTPNGKTVATKEVTGAECSKVEVSAPVGYEYLERVFGFVTISKEHLYQKVMVLDSHRSQHDKFNKIETDRENVSDINTDEQGEAIL
ncbi:hypothetical protein FC27_GL001840 [Companilactobacillus versmoldensis DSM 14857 = KCTC 3814]|uniref:Uncharacterized protein n=2 Tax=Companilactobacillus versmoldensis TaxID=194326 RepID=A0A0R1SJ05_9LACO|nr:hypothetical protein FC27_GL001840 [Companilactobacillus versmoldensis DSM 14857 = KCTC 3814]